jgi:hypothetical protein
MSETGHNYESEVQTNFARNLTKAYQKAFLGVEDERLKFGPVMETITNKGKQFEMHTIVAAAELEAMIDTNAGYVPHLLSHLVLALDTEEKLAGFRIAHVGITPQDLQVTSDIATAARGTGLATKLDMATLFLLRCQATRMRMPIEWMIENGNRRRLEKKVASGLSEEELTPYREEQARWQALYGPEGKLGFTPVGDTAFAFLNLEPSRDYERFKPEQIDRMKMLDFDAYVGMRRIIVPWPLNVVVSDKHELQDRKLEHFRSVLEPKVLKVIESQGPAHFAADCC